ncbi:MAG: anti-sigma B factor antagonist [Candidatus Omnitrophota bacterium]|jgi:anti-sigma B factor antagonist
MDVQLSDENGITIAKVEGEINISTSPALKKEFEKIETANVVINLELVGYVDSSGLATLVEVLKKVRAKGGALHLTHLSDKVVSLFEITKLDKLFGIFSNDEDAISNFK